jgi:phosphoglycerate kinase
LGGGKLETKLPLLDGLLDLVDIVALGPAIVFTFLKALNKKTGKSLVDDQQIKHAKTILQKMAEKQKKVLFPVDYMISRNRISSTLLVVSADDFPDDAIGISIGPKTAAIWGKYIVDAATIFFNCAMGFHEIPETLTYTNELINLLGTSNAYTVVGGGDSVSLALRSDAARQIDFLSTGGGATLTYLAGKPLPGLEIFMQSDKNSTNTHHLSNVHE